MFLIYAIVSVRYVSVELGTRIARAARSLSGHNLNKLRQSCYHKIPYRV
jgi:hypothetical protein